MLIQNDLKYSELYTQDLQLIQDFFQGKTDNIKEKLESEIISCIEVQNFERAAKLRDIYKNIDQFTQKQTVILDTFISGVVAKILKVESQWIIIVLVFQQGKLIDVIRSKESVEDLEYEQLKIAIELDFGELKEKDNLIISKGIKFDKKAMRELELHFDQFVHSFIASSARQENSLVSDLLKGLESRYALSFFPLRIECLDISHFSGGWASGGLSCMEGGIANKKGYRRYKIKKAKGGDDYDSLREVILRRFGDTKKPKDKENEATNSGIASSEYDGFPASSQGRNFLPDLFILDGAEKQLDVVRKLFEDGKLDLSLLDTVQFASLLKGDARRSGQKIRGEKEKLYILTSKSSSQGNILTPQPTSPSERGSKSENFEFGILNFELQYDEVDRLLIRLRDEAHRFANAYREKQQSMELKTIR